MQTKRYIGWITGSAALLALSALSWQAVGQRNPPAPPRTSVNLGEFWPANAPSRTWELIPRARAGDPNAPVFLQVQNQTVGPDRFILWFRNTRRLRSGQRNGELYRVCRLPDRSWLFLESYLNSFPGKPLIEHPLSSDRILFSSADGRVKDLISDGEYKACGGHGQPHLLWSDPPWNYRIQVWGHLTQRAKFKWYRDAVVSGPRPLVNNCLQPAETRLAVEIHEAAWSTFKDPFGRWMQGTGDTNPGSGLPTGNAVRYGRTLWDGAGQIPYFMTGPGAGPDVTPRRCVDRISAATR